MHRGSVQVRLGIIIVVITTLILVGYTAFDYMIKKKAMMGDIKDHAEVTSTRLGKALVDPLWNIDKKAIDDLIKSEMTEKDMFADTRPRRQRRYSLQRDKTGFELEPCYSSGKDRGGFYHKTNRYRKR